ncbi:MAG: ADP-glyceromanno-heptose 6-epimerase [Chitinophagaceae bacterium]
MQEFLTNKYIVVTGAAGFIGSCLVGFLNVKGFDNLVLVDDFSIKEKDANLLGKKYQLKIEREEFFSWLDTEQRPVAFIFHLGARTDTTEFDYAVHQHLNVDYSQKIWKFCTEKNIPLVYASSAATYGNGEMGYDDEHYLTEKLAPLNPYGKSKNEFDKWALRQENQPPGWAGLKFFNVYGPNEYHKGRMASVIYHAFNQVKTIGLVRLFRSHKAEIKDGEQLRDFIYVKDIVKVCYWFMKQFLSGDVAPSAIYNLGTGVPRTFNDLVLATFQGMKISPQIEYINMPADIRDSYQYFTIAKMDKLRTAGYSEDFTSLEDGILDYVHNYLMVNKNY